jgi:hypothetical protein
MFDVIENLGSIQMRDRRSRGRRGWLLPIELDRGISLGC